MPCGCQNACGCIVLGDGVTTTAVTVGDTTTVSAIQTFLGVADTNCVNLSIAAGIVSGVLTLAPAIAGVGLACTGAGLLASIIIDPASTAPISVGPLGLRVDCCAASPPLTSDTSTVNLSTPAGILQADVIPNTSAGIENQGGGVSIKLQGDPAPLGAAACGNRLRFNNVGDLVELQDGLAVRFLADGAQVAFPAIVGNPTIDSFVAVITNNDTCPVYVRINGVASLQATASNGAAGIKQISETMNLRISAVTGVGSLDIGGDGLYTISEQGTGVLDVGAIMRWRGQLEKWALIVPGGTATFRSGSFANLATIGYSSAPAPSFYQFVNPILSIYPQRIGSWLV